MKAIPCFNYTTPSTFTTGLGGGGFSYLPAKAKTGKNVPRQCLRCVSSPMVGLYHSSIRWGGGGCSYLPAKAKTGKNVPRQCLRCVSSSVVGLYHSSIRWERILEETTRPDNNSLAKPSAATVLSSEL